MDDMLSGRMGNGETRGRKAHGRRRVPRLAGWQTQGWRVIAALWATLALALPGGALAATDRPAPAVVLVFGDSLSAGYGMALEAAWPSLLGRELARQPDTRDWQVVNDSLSGETTRGGLARLPAALARVHPAVVIVELGGNDALRGLPVQQARDNLLAMGRLVEQAHAHLLVVGVALPPNFGDALVEAYAACWQEVARRSHAPLVPNLVARLGTSRDAFQADGIHPQASHQRELLDEVLPPLRPLLRRAR